MMKRLLIMIVGILAIGFGGWIIYKLSGAIVGGMIGGLVVWYLTRNDRRSQQVSAAPASPIQEIDVDDLLGRLLEMGILIREETFPSAVIECLDRIIGLLRDVVPKLNAQHQGIDITWLVNRMVTNYLPLEAIASFRELSEGTRESKSGVFIESLSGLESQLRKIKQSLDMQDESTFAISAAFLRSRFEAGCFTD